MSLKPDIYKKKNPRKSFVKQIILYSIFLVLSLVIGQWKFAIVFAVLIAVTGFMLYRKKDAGTYSVADYIHAYDSDFPTENPKGNSKKEKRQIADRRRQDYEDYIAKVEEEYDSYDYGDDEYDDYDDEDEYDE